MAHNDLTMESAYTKINLGDIKIHQKTWGTSPPEILLLHGLASNLRIWDLVAPILVQKGHSVLAIDLRGHGLSSKPTNGYDFDTVSNDVIRTIDHLGLRKPILVGHSWGGNVAVHIGAHFPDHIKGLCLIDGGLIEISKIPHNTRKKSLDSMAPPDFNGWTRDEMIKRLQTRDWGIRDCYSKKFNLDEIVLSNFHISRNSAITPHFRRLNHLKVISAFWAHKPTELFSSITVPTLIMPAFKSNHKTSIRTTTRDQVLAIAESLIPQSKVVRLEDSIHDVPLQKPLLVAKILSAAIKEGFFRR